MSPCEPSLSRSLNASGTLAALFLAGMLASASSTGFSEWSWSRAASEMRPDRVVQEQDCTKPIELSGNLRCR